MALRMEDGHLKVQKLSNIKKLCLERRVKEMLDYILPQKQKKGLHFDSVCFILLRELTATLLLLRKSDVQLLDDFKLMMLDKQTSGVVIPCGANKFHWHRNILAALSPIFRRMFEADIK